MIFYAIKGRPVNIQDDVKVLSPSKPKNKVKSVLLIIAKVSLCIVLIVGAVMGGNIVGDLIIGKFDTFDPSKYKEENYVETQANIDLWMSKNISSLNATQIFVVAENKLLANNCYGVYTKGYDGGDKGTVTTLGMKQDLYGYRYKLNDKGYFDYYSTGLATVVKKVEFTYGEDKYYCYEGKISGNTTNFTLNKTDSGCEYRTGEEYKAMAGVIADNAIDYIVSTKTVLSFIDNGKVGDHYSFTLNLDPNTSVLKYVKKMDYMSGFGYPKFSKIELRFEVDEDMNFRNIYINEDYKVIGMSANGKYKMEFVYGEENIEIR